MRSSAFERWAPGCALLLLLVGLPASLWRAERRITRAVARTLSVASGQRVSIESVLFSLQPALQLDRVRVGDALSIARVEIAIDTSTLSRPRLASVTLLRPALTLSAHRTEALWDALARERLRAASSETKRKTAARRGRELDLLRVVDGRLVVELSSGTHRYTLDVQRLDLPARARGAASRRLVLGETRLLRDRTPLLSLAASGLDLDENLRPRRAAVLGGRLVLPSGWTRVGSDAALTVQTLRLRRLRGGALRLLLKARPPRRDAGHLWLTVDIAHGSLRRARLHVARLRLSPYAPLLARVGWLAERSRVDGDLFITAAAADASADGVPGARALSRRDGYALRGDLLARRVRIEHPWIAAGIVGPFDANIEANAHLDERGVLTLKRARVASGSLELRLAGRIAAAAKGLKLALDAEMPQLPCQRLLTDLPRGFAPHLDGIGVEGDVGARFALRVDSSKLDDTHVDLALLPKGTRSCTVKADPPAADVNTLAKSLTIAVGGARGLGRRLRLGKSNKHFRSYRRIPKHVRDAFVVAEDTHFYRHRGFDPKQLRNAFVANLRAGRLVRGASTISQQLVKNVFLHHARTLSRKFEEVVLTWRMEQVLAKRRILELYLNMVEMGAGVYGVQAAAQRYFGRDVSELTPLQAAHLAALTPAPRPLSRRFAKAEPDAKWMDKLHLLLRLMRRSGSISRGQQRVWAKRKLVLVRR
ncbi:MAG: transglycosylase domain-containing protein [Myxococcales bacterium]|nr:transglycosylase domain-containing protein [Myxococcales bacterium]